jgi:sulfoxide reductase heme-binding subunit YedZ
MHDRPSVTRRRQRGPHPWLKPAVFVGSLTPLAAILWRAATSALGANPIAEALNLLGLSALIFLAASLACTPLKTLLGWTWPIRVRRMVGLFAFFYALLHVAVYTGLDQGLAWRAIWADVTKRKFIFVGFAAFVMLVPLAATSTQAAVRRLGFVAWKRLHRLAYFAGGLAAIHFIWRVKKDIREPMAYASVVAVLLAVRVVVFARSRLARRREAERNAMHGREGSAPGRLASRHDAG